MKATILQTDIIWGDVEKNITHVDQMLSSVPGSDLYVLPEMWSTGFTTKQTAEMAELESSSQALAWMRRFADEHQCAISGSLAIKLTAAGDYRNRHYFIDGRLGKEYYYDKHHLFRHGGEHQFFTEGDSHTIVSYCGIRFLLLTCYDLRFPLWSRYSSDNQFDCIIVAANWPDSRQNAWQILTRSRAIENQAYLIGCNRVGDDLNSHYTGNSAIVSAIGKTLGRCRSDCEDSVSCELDIEALNRMRLKFKVLDDRDPFQIL